MIIFPAMDLRDGKCVRLYQGKFDEMEVVGENPIEVAMSFKKAGAEYIHMVDLDGALNGSIKNLKIILKVINEVNIPVELGGGIRDIKTVDALIEAGVSRVILGTAALKDKNFVAEAAEKYGDKIAVGIDAKDEKVAVNGWTNISDVNYIDFAKEIENMGVKTIIFTDISKDGTLMGPNLVQLQKINDSVNCNIIASGGIKELEDLKIINKMGLYGTIVGKAIYSGNVDLKEAIATGKEIIEKTVVIKMSKFWNEITKTIEPYVSGEQPKDKKYIKLNTNENPYPPSEKVLKAIKDAASSDLRLYPDPDCDLLRETVAEYYDLNKNQVFVGNGSDEVLALSFLTFFSSDEAIVYPDISYSFYPVYANLYGLKTRLSKLNEDFSINAQDFLSKNGGVVIPNPNAPTGKFLEVSAIKRILDYNSEKVVIIDEAYVDFGGESVVNLIKDYPNLLVVQTLSKSRSLAGMRVGLALGQEELIHGLNRIKNSFNSYTADAIAQVAAVAAFKDEKYFKKCTKRIIKTRENTVKKLTEIGFSVVPSKANFIFATHKAISAETLFIKLREKGVLVRYFNKPKINNYLRITIGSEEEMDVFLEKVKEIIK